MRFRLAFPRGQTFYATVFVLSTIASAVGMTSTYIMGAKLQVIGVDAATSCALVAAGTFTFLRRLPRSSERLVAAAGIPPVVVLAAIAILAPSYTFLFHLASLISAVWVFVLGLARHPYRALLYFLFAAGAVALFCIVAYLIPAGRWHPPLIFIMGGPIGWFQPR